MGTAEQKTLGWIDQAPFSFSGSAMTKASPDAVFAVLADHERWPEWFPVITKTVVLEEQREGVGTRRLTNIPGGSIEEVILAWDVGRRFSFTATAVHPAIVHALRNRDRRALSRARAKAIRRRRFLQLVNHAGCGVLRIR